jgi:hypothetical protein
MLRPAAVDVSAVDVAIDLGLGKGGGSEAGEESVLEAAQSYWRIAPENPPQLPCARPVVAAGENAFDLVRRGPMPDRSLVEGARGLILGQDRRKVDERSWHGCHGDPAPARGVH